MSDVTQILTACQSGDTSVRTQAEKTLQQARTSNLPQFYVAMSGELCNDLKPKNTRQLAGVILKNCLDANNDQLAEQRAKNPRSIGGRRNVGGSSSACRLTGVWSSAWTELRAPGPAAPPPLPCSWSHAGHSNRRWPGW